MSLINKEISDFKVDAFQKKAGAAQGEFTQYTKADLKGKWSVFFFYPADFSLSARRNSQTFRNSTASSRSSAVRSSLSPATPTSFTRHGMRVPILSAS